MMGRDEARHLAARTGFGPTAAQVEVWAKRTRQEAVDDLIAGLRDAPVSAPPPSLDEPLLPAGDKDDKGAKRARRRQRRAQRQDLKAWWAGELLATPSPLTERLTLLWHGHFTSSLQKVKRPALMWRQHLTLRAHAAGSFGALLHAISRDPAMLLYLDGQRSRRDMPNENFARELLELFTLGPGHYTEADIAAAALAFTGWRINQATGETAFVLAAQDKSQKTFLGQTGPWIGLNVLDIILKHPALPASITQKLWGAFVSQPPDAPTLAALASGFAASGLQLKPLLRAVLLSDAFWDPRERGQRIKSPIELLIGLAATLQLDPSEDLARLIAQGSQRLGQALFDPPSVKGWPSGRDWINTQTLRDRAAATAQLLRWEPIPSLTDLTTLLGPDPRQVLLPPAPALPDLDPDASAAEQLETLCFAPHIHLV
jgi:uncharacterized protein (DUF1800 family)